MLFAAAKPDNAFHTAHIHIRIHPLQPHFQAGDRLIGRRKETRFFVSVPDEPVGSLMLSLYIKAAAECPAGLQYPKTSR